MAKFNIDDYFEIKASEEIILVTSNISGIIKVGDKFKIGTKVHQIKSIEHIDGKLDQVFNAKIALRVGNDLVIKELENMIFDKNEIFILKKK